ncbi:MAG: hypothetical protein QXU11_11280 [Thermoproteota archaeon]
MVKPMRSFERLVAVSLAVYLASLLMVLTIVFNPPQVPADPSSRKTLTWIVFNAICLAGVFASVSPETCSRVFPGKAGGEASPRRRIEGHHPVCEAFSTHVVKIGGRVFCAACTGLFLGGVSAMVFSTAYFLPGLSLEKSPQPVLMGAIMVMLVPLGQAAKGFTRVLLNLVFPIGGMLVLIGLDNLYESLFLNVFITALIVFWIMVRIMVSSLSHWKTCSSCGSRCTAETDKNFQGLSASTVEGSKQYQHAEQY